jgi:hypothetical protein
MTKKYILSQLTANKIINNEERKKKATFLGGFLLYGVPKGIRTPVAAVKDLSNS